MVTRMVLAQAGLEAAIGLSFSRRHLPSIVITLILAVALLGLALLTRTGAHAAWVTAIAAESAFGVFGIWRYLTSRYLGGTLFALVCLGALLYPSVARGFSPAARPAPGLADGPLGEAALGDGAGEAIGGRAAG